MTHLWLAVDHAREALFRAPDGTDIRPGLLGLVARSAGWGSVVPPQECPGVRTRVCAGLPDITSVAELAVPAVVTTDAVKVGFEDGGAGCATVARAILERLGDYRQVFLEPYCSGPGCLEELAALAAGRPGVVLKLKVTDPGLEAVERAGLADMPEVTWVARSDGMSWDDFRARLPRLRTLGAAGVMVGRALWGDATEVASDLRDELVGARMREVESHFAGEPRAPLREPREDVRPVRI